jgi:hypothetical protein
MINIVKWSLDEISQTFFQDTQALFFTDSETYNVSFSAQSIDIPV